MLLCHCKQKRHNNSSVHFSHRHPNDKPSLVKRAHLKITNSIRAMQITSFRRIFSTHKGNDEEHDTFSRRRKTTNNKKRNKFTTTKPTETNYLAWHGTLLNENSSTFTYPFALKSHILPPPPPHSFRFIILLKGVSIWNDEESNFVLVTQFKLSHNAEEIVDYLMSKRTTLFVSRTRQTR